MLLLQLARALVATFHALGGSQPTSLQEVGRQAAKAHKFSLNKRLYSSYGITASSCSCRLGRLVLGHPTISPRRLSLSTGVPPCLVRVLYVG